MVYLCRFRDMLYNDNDNDNEEVFIAKYNISEWNTKHTCDMTFIDQMIHSYIIRISK